MRIRKGAGAPRVRWGEPDKRTELRDFIASRAYECLPRSPSEWRRQGDHDRPRAPLQGSGSRQVMCERCHVRKAEMLVVGEREGMAVYICRRCREPSRFPMYLVGGSRRRRS